MSLNSVNTNVGAQIALQNLQKTNSELATTQNRINTGKAINSAKDNGAIWAIAQSQRAESASLNAVKSSLQRGQSTVDVALSAGESVSDLLTQMKSLALSASDASLGTAARASLNEDFISLRDRITTVVANASFDGTNLINAGTAGFKALANAKGTSTINVAQQNLSLGGTIVTVAAAGVVSSATAAAAMITTVDTSIRNVSTALSKLGTGSKAFENHLTFVGKLQDSLDAGVGNLVDADLAKESARLQSLQTKQQLGVQALSIANSSSSILLGLFR
ncbi:MAG: flagellin [Brevundimonas sp.]|jgi:flagellin|uniref:flagellin n=1 Tax=Brevundimonas sp. TaxID=1871086 RepID=UPI001A2E7E95|nr:flagellin [Brevundimonas sp.]MBJ7448375.1 flagellin [Brevundimonas sp.]